MTLRVIAASRREGICKDPVLIAAPLQENGTACCRGFRGRTIWVADAHRGDGKRFVARPDEKLTAFLELESAMRAYDELS
jgi:hypothetical protein